mgnify:CR=1 FL=1
MAVVTASAPLNNICRNATRSTTMVIVEELNRAVRCASLASVMDDGLPEFCSRYSAYLAVTVSATTASDYTKW